MIVLLIVVFPEKEGCGGSGEVFGLCSSGILAWRHSCVSICSQVPGLTLELHIRDTDRRTYAVPRRGRFHLAAVSLRAANWAGICGSELPGIGRGS